MSGVPNKMIVFISVFLTAIQLFSQTDTLAIKSYYKAVVPRTLYNYKQQNISFISNFNDSIYSSNKFSTGNQHFLGADVSYKWVTIGYYFSLSPDNTKRNLDLHFSTAYKPIQLQINYSKLQNLNYSFVISDNNFNKSDTLIQTKESDISITNTSLKVDYVFNYKKYCYSAAFSQGGKQLKSKGSPLASLSYANESILLNNLSSEVKTSFDTIYGFDKGELNRFDLGVGYGYNWVIFKNWTLAFVELPNISYVRAEANSITEDIIKINTVGFANQFKAGVIYTYKSAFIGSCVNNTLIISNLNNVNYSNVYTSVNVYVGWVFPTKI